MTRCMIDTTLQNAATVAVSTDDDAIDANSVKNELHPITYSQIDQHVETIPERLPERDG